MEKLYDLLKKDIRFEEGLKACINCGTCTAICPSAEFYNYDPRAIVEIVQGKYEKEIETLLKSNVIWYCSECMSCKTRCPRGNAPGLIIIALRSLSQDLGYFVESEKGRQQLFMKRSVGEWILTTGYCLYLKGVGTDLYPEQGPVWDWIQENYDEVFKRLGANFNGEGSGILRKIPESAMDELRKIFEVTGGIERFNKIEEFSEKKATELGIELKPGLDNDYVRFIYESSNEDHF